MAIISSIIIIIIILILILIRILIIIIIIIIMVGYEIKIRILQIRKFEYIACATPCYFLPFVVAGSLFSSPGIIL